MTNELIKKNTLPIRLLVAAAIIFLLLPDTLMDGMFMDGTLYTCVSKNLAHGIGNFWFPHFSALGMSDKLTFHEQPPLGFGIESLFFRLLGDSIYTERVYSLLTALITIILIGKIWKEIMGKDDTERSNSWLPVLLWIVNPITLNVYRDNLLENTMGIFTLLAVYFILRGLRTSNYLKLFLGGSFIFCATLTKGFPGLFPVVLIPIYFICFRKPEFKKAIISSLLVFITPVLLYALLFCFDAPRNSLYLYIHDRVLNSIKNVETVNSRFYILYQLVKYSSIAILIAGIFILFGASVSKNLSAWKNNKKESLFFFLLAVSASVPLIITREQRGFYLSTSIPLYALFLGALASPYVSCLVKKIKKDSIPFKLSLLVSVLAVTGSILFSATAIGKIKRDEDLLHDIYLIGKVVPANSIVSVPPAMWDNWQLQCYMIRHFEISIDPRLPVMMEYYIVQKQMDTIPLPGFERENIGCKDYFLYKKNK